MKLRERYGDDDQFVTLTVFSLDQIEQVEDEAAVYRWMKFKRNAKRFGVKNDLEALSQFLQTSQDEIDPTALMRYARTASGAKYIITTALKGSEVEYETFARDKGSLDLYNLASALVGMAKRDPFFTGEEKEDESSDPTESDPSSETDDS